MKNKFKHTRTAFGVVRRNAKFIALGTVAGMVIYAQHKGIAQMTAFLEEKGLTDEYFLSNES